MSLWCEEGCRVRDRNGCQKHPMAPVERIPPLDGYIWFGEQEEKPFQRGRKRHTPVGPSNEGLSEVRRQ